MMARKTGTNPRSPLFCISYLASRTIKNTVFDTFFKSVQRLTLCRILSLLWKNSFSIVETRKEIEPRQQPDNM